MIVSYKARLNPEGKTDYELQGDGSKICLKHQIENKDETANII